MVKVATPILYEPSMDELNRVRPLQLSTRSRLFLDYPVLCKNPIGEGRPVVGKFLRCDEQGAVLKRNSNSFTGYELKTEQFYAGHDKRVITFSRKVSAMVFEVIFNSQANVLSIYASDFLTWVKDYWYAGVYFEPFRCQSIYFWGDGRAFWDIDVNAYGFY